MIYKSAWYEQNKWSEEAEFWELSEIQNNVFFGFYQTESHIDKIDLAINQANIPVIIESVERYFKDHFYLPDLIAKLKQLQEHENSEGP